MDINELLFVGTNKYGQAGIGEKHHNKTFPTPKSFAFPIFIKQISCGAHHSALLTIDGHVYTMGSNIHGALGSNPALNYSFAPTLVDTLAEVTKIECGPFHMCAISEGCLYSWGKGIDGQLGHGNTKNLAKPAKVQALGDCVDSASCGTNHTLVILKREGKSECFAFGNGIYGQLGTGQSRNSYTPAKVKLQGVQGVAAGDNHSLFIQKGRVFACGDNSNGQLGALFAKKFNPEPTKVEFQADNDNIITVQAKKYSLAITDSGEMFVWGLKSGFGAPKRVIDGRLGSDKCYGLSTEGSLYSWDVFRGQQGPDGWVCESETVVSNSRAVLDFSVGEGYLLILGDIVKQVEYSSVPASALSCFQDVEPPQEPSLKHEESRFRESQIHSLDSNPLFSGQESQFDRIKPQSLSPMEPPPLRELPHSFLKQKPAQEKQELASSCLHERKDFNNLVHLALLEKREHSKGFSKVQEPPCENLNEDTFEDGTFDIGKSHSSSIQCEPTNFLKESLKESLRIEQPTKRGVSSLLQSEAQMPALQELRQPARAGSRKDKENECEAGRSEKREKSKKIDKIMQLLEKSNHIGGKGAGEEVELGGWEDSTKEMEIIKTNRILRVQLREKELKISQMQELLSRKEMEIEAQRELIKLLREKNASNFASLQPL